jgi:(1->4)-alpha-D-glucan 1-alpha-D-glucosylmutase
MILDFLQDALTLDLIKPPRVGHSSARVRRFAFKVQQFTGPAMAKSLEDTAFYRFHRLLAFNEVGGNPAAGVLSVAEFHARMQERARVLPHGLTATATHDTKRGEDARARILALSEVADEWSEAVARWRALNAPLAQGEGASRAPSPAHEYMLYQALIGAWPLGGFGQDFVDRMKAYAIKAAREGKNETSWYDPDERYEARLAAFVEGILDRSRSARFLAEFESFAQRAALLGALNSLSQLTLKMTLPGVPDIYQGTEFWDLSLVDPDNRHEPDFCSRAAALSSLPQTPDWRALAAEWRNGQIKLALMRALALLRQRLPHVFTRGAYRPLSVEGMHRNEIIAFARISGRDAVVVATGRLFGRVSNGGLQWPAASARDASLNLDEFSLLRNWLSPDIEGGPLTLAKLLEDLPFAVLQANVGVSRPIPTSTTPPHMLPKSPRNVAKVR